MGGNRGGKDTNQALESQHADSQDHMQHMEDMLHSQQRHITTLQIQLNSLLGNTPDNTIELDHMHRVPSTHNPCHSGPRDMLCRVQFFTIKGNSIIVSFVL